MADAFVSDEGRHVGVNILNQALGSSPTVRLYKNDYTPVNGSVIADFTEADFDGYGAETPAVEAHGLDAVNHRGYIRWTEVTFTKTAGATTNIIYGWFLTVPDPDTGMAWKVLMARRFSPPLGMLSAGDAIPVHPEYQHDHT